MPRFVKERWELLECR